MGLLYLSVFILFSFTLLWRLTSIRLLVRRSSDLSNFPCSPSLKSVFAGRSHSFEFAYIQFLLFSHISPLPQPTETKTLHLTNFFFLWQNLLFLQNNYIFFLNIINFELWPIKSLFQKKSTFLEKCHCTNFFRGNCEFAPKTKTKKKVGVSFIWKLKAKWFQNTLDLHYDKRIWGRNDFANLDNAVLLPQKIALFDPLLDIKPFLTMKNLITVSNDLHH